MKLLGKVDRLPSFLLEMAHAEGAWAMALYFGDCLVADICRRGNRSFNAPPLSVRSSYSDPNGGRWNAASHGHPR
jgi:hypothetical protein